MLKCSCNNQQMQEILWGTIHLLNNVYAGSGKQENEKTMMKQTDESWWMISQMSHAK